MEGEEGVYWLTDDVRRGVEFLFFYVYFSVPVKCILVFLLAGRRGEGGVGGFG